MKKRFQYLVIAIAAIAFFTGCATHSVEHITNPPGFIKGLIHGFILLFSFIGSLFTDYEIYSVPNNGGWYNFGFLLGIMLFFGGGGAGAKR